MSQLQADQNKSGNQLVVPQQQFILQNSSNQMISHSNELSNPLDNSNNSNNSLSQQNPNSSLEQMYAKCIQRSKNLLNKNESLLNTLKTETQRSQNHQIITQIIPITQTLHQPAQQQQLNTSGQGNTSTQFKTPAVQEGRGPQGLDQSTDSLSQQQAVATAQHQLLTQSQKGSL